MLHPELDAAWRNVALADDKLRAIQDEAIRLSPFVFSGEIAKPDAVDALWRIALNHDLCSTHHRLDDAEHVIGEGLKGIATLLAVPKTTTQKIASNTPVSVSRETATPLASASSAQTGLSAADLQRITFAPLNYVVPGYIEQGLTLLAGKPKRGKSWLCLHVAIAVSRGGFTLGDVKCGEGDVLYCALEDNKRRLQRRMTKLMGTQDWPARLRFEIAMPRLKDGGVEFVRSWIKHANNPRLIIIDTLAKVRDPRGREQTGYEADYGAVAELKALADEYGLAIILVHHQRKLEAEDPLDSVSGTTGLTGAVDTVIVLIHDGQGVRLYGRGRDIDEIDKAVEFSPDTCVWKVLGEAQSVRRSDERGEILEVLHKAANSMTPQQLASATDKPPVNIRKLLSKMVSAGEVIKTKRGAYLHPDHIDHKVTSEDGDEGEGDSE